MCGSTVERERPKSPNIQIYRPQLTSVLSIANRISGVITSFVAVGLVLWLLAVAAGPQTYAAAQGVLASPLGQIGLVIAIFAFFLHLCGGIRHLAWDAVYGFYLATIYASGWAVVAGKTSLHR
jgi:succinate dehydrogenase / fumarate reductase cytochrome b subunit